MKKWRRAMNCPDGFRNGMADAIGAQQRLDRGSRVAGFLSLLALLVMGVTSSAAPAGADRIVQSPNIVLINADDLGYGDLGCYGATLVRTPNIDRLAREGMRFTDAHTASAVCSPSRYGLMTASTLCVATSGGPPS